VTGEEGNKQSQTVIGQHNVNITVVEDEKE